LAKSIASRMASWSIAKIAPASVPEHGPQLSQALGVLAAMNGFRDSAVRLAN
jgi:hypothetical protein